MAYWDCNPKYFACELTEGSDRSIDGTTQVKVTMAPDEGESGGWETFNIERYSNGKFVIEESDTIDDEDFVWEHESMDDAINALADHLNCYDFTITITGHVDQVVHIPEDDDDEEVNDEEEEFHCEYDVTWEGDLPRWVSEDNALDEASAVTVTINGVDVRLEWCEPGDGHYEEHPCVMFRYTGNDDYDDVEFSEDYLGGSMHDTIEYLLKENDVTKAVVKVVEWEGARRHEAAANMLEELLPLIARGLGKGDLNHNALVDIVVKHMREE